MAHGLADIEGIGPTALQQLEAASIITTADLLARCGTAQGRTDIAARTGIGEELLLKWVTLADLMRVPGVEVAEARLLEAAGVRSVGDLQASTAATLAAKLKEAHTEVGGTPEAPSLETVAGWGREAAQLPPAVSY